MNIPKTRKIYLIITKGCYACQIMEHILDEVHALTLYTFSTEVVDFNEAPEWIKINVPLYDFPTMVFVENNTIKYHTTGTMTVRKLLDIIQDIHFN